MNLGDIFYLNTLSLEDWAPGQPDEIWRKVEVTETYTWDQVPRIKIRILEGPEKGRVVSGLSPSNLRESKPGVEVKKPATKAPPSTPSKQTPGKKPWYTVYLEKLLGIISEYQQPRTVSVKGNTLDVTFDVRTDTLHPMVLSKWNTYTKRRGLTSTSNKHTGEFTATVLDTRELPSVGQVVVAVPPKGLRFAKDRHFKGEVKQVDPDGTVHIMSYSDDKVVPVFATNIIEYKTDSGWHNPSVILPNTEVVQSFIKRGLLAQYLPPTLARG